MEQTLLTLTMENFHHCSHLPIRAFNKEGKEIAAFGFSAQDLSMIESHLAPNLKEKLLELLLKQKLIHHPLTDEIYLTLCLITPDMPLNGAFIIGPYTTSPISKEALVFKPLHCMTHLTELLYSIYSSQHTLPSEEEHPHNLLQCEPCNTPRTICPIALTTEDEYSYHVTKAEIYIEKNYHKPLTLQELADYLGINKSYFCTIFKKVTKQSFCTYTNNVRIEKSKYLLKNTEDSILDIALTTGFSSSSYFNNTFKKIVGQTPLEYRFHHKTHH